MVVVRSTLMSRRTAQKFRQAAISAVGSLKIKLLLLCCFLFALFLLLSLTPSFFGWGHQSLPSTSIDRTSSKGYTLLINTWKRYDLLKQSISHYTSCPGLDSIHIVWSEPDPPSDSLVKFLNHAAKSNVKDGRHIELAFDINKEDSLNNRFKEINNPITDAVFSIDDDIIFSCSTVEFAYSVWRSAPDTMVGFVPRIHLINPGKENGYSYIYGGWWPVWWTGTYSMILSKASFFHRKYLRMYTNEMPASLLEYVKRNRNCEDIAMSFLVANATGAPPIWAKGKINEIGSTGISSLGGHNIKRTECVNRCVSEFGRMPLVPTTVKAVDSRGTWFWVWTIFSFIALYNLRTIHFPTDLSSELFPDKANKTLTIIHNGAGMIKNELLCYMSNDALVETVEGVIEPIQDKFDDVTLFDQSHLGLYFAYLVADKVVVTTKQKYDDQYVWEWQAGQDSFTLTRDTSEYILDRGSRITLYLNEDQLEYLEEERLKELIRKYSFVIRCPIYLSVTETSELKTVVGGRTSYNGFPFLPSLPPHQNPPPPGTVSGPGYINQAEIMLVSYIRETFNVVRRFFFVCLSTTLPMLWTDFDMRALYYLLSIFFPRDLSSVLFQTRSTKR